jgi:amidase
VIVGITNTPEYGIVPTTEPALHGATRNPWNVGHSTGGSSGGSAAAVASGMVPLAHANDGGGSIRIPAACCGVFGLKPTRARNPCGPEFGDYLHGFVVEHAVSRSVRDSAALLDATEGADLGAPYHAPAKARPYAEEARTPPGKLRIGLVTRSMTGVPIEPEVSAGLADAARLCAELGHEVVEVTPNAEGPAVSDAFITLWVGGCAFAVSETAARLGKTPTPEELEPLTWALYEMGKGIPLTRYLASLARLQATARRLAEQFEAFDLWMSPTTAHAPLPLGSFDAAPGNPLAGLFKAAEFAPFTPMANATGQPAMSVPLAWSQAGLPIGIHFVARFGDEATLFRLAGQLEQARPWATRKPEVHA